MGDQNSERDQIEKDVKELRLAEHAFFREMIQGIKKKHKWVIFLVVSLALGFLVVWSCFACPFLHKIGLCPGHH